MNEKATNPIVKSKEYLKKSVTTHWKVNGMDEETLEGNQRNPSGNQRINGIISNKSLKNFMKSNRKSEEFQGKPLESYRKSKGSPKRSMKSYRKSQESLKQSWKSYWKNKGFPKETIGIR